MAAYVTDGEMSRWMSEQQDFRARLEHRLGAQHTEVVDRLDRIETQVRETNGRTRQAEADIAVEEREIEAIKATLGTMSGTMSRAIAAAPDGPCWPALTPKQKAAAGGGLLVIAMPALVEIVKGTMGFLQWAGGMR